MILAIDTATRFISIALHDGHTLLMEQTWQSDNLHTEQLAPAIQQLFRFTETSPDQLSAIGVSIGPGSYTGLRIGVAMAKGMCAIHTLPLIGMSTLDLLAYSHTQHPAHTGLVAIVAAGRGRVIVNSYRWKKGTWQSHSEPRLMTWEKLIETLDGAAVITGEINPHGREILEGAIASGKSISIASPATRARRAGFLADYAWEQFRATEDKSVFEPNQLIPIYMQDETPA